MARTLALKMNDDSREGMNDKVSYRNLRSAAGCDARQH